MTAVLLLIVLVVLVSAGLGGALVARRRPGLRSAARHDGSGRRGNRNGVNGVNTGNGGNGGIDPFAVSEPWRRFLQDALRAQDQFRVTMRAAAPGPLREQLEDIGRTLHGGVTGAWSTAREGHRLTQARRGIDADQLAARLAQLGPAPDSTDESDEGGADALGQSLRAQLDSARRLDTVIEDAEQQLRLLTAQLDEAVARAAELAARAGPTGSLETVAADITRVSDQLEGLRLALEETDRL